MSLKWIRFFDSVQDSVFAAAAAILAAALIKVTVTLLRQGDIPHALLTSFGVLLLIVALVWWIAQP